MKRHILQTTLFCLLLLLALSHASSVLKRKESDVKYQPFLRSGMEYDVLFMGNSHMVNGVFPMELWDQHGIAAYNIAGYGNTLPVSYWAMRNAFDYASPRLMVIDISNVSKEYKLTGSSGDLHKAFDSYPLSLNKLRAIHDLIDDPTLMDDSGVPYMDMKWEYILPLGKYHSRWNDLDRSDFHPNLTVQKGAEAIFNVAVPRAYEIFEDGYATSETGFGFIYLRKIIEECRRRGIEILLVHLPFPTKAYQQQDANAVRYIAEEYDVHFVDLAYMDQVVDYDTDLYDSSSHLNASSGQKVSDFIGKYIVDHYAVPDRRNDSRYSRWADDYAAYLQKKINDLRQQDSVSNVLMMLHDESFSLRLFIPSGSSLYMDDTLLLLMQNIAREHVFEKDEFLKYSYAMYPLAALDEAVWSESDYFLSIDRSTGILFEAVGEQARTLGTELFSEDDTAGLHMVLLDAEGETELLRRSIPL